MNDKQRLKVQEVLGRMKALDDLHPTPVPTQCVNMVKQYRECTKLLEKVLE